MQDLKLHFIEKILLSKVKNIIQTASNIIYESYNKNKPLKILIVGYSGKRNIGAEVRAAEIIKQIKAMPLNIELEFGVLTFNPEASRPFYTNDVKMVPLNSIFFKSITEACSNYHMGILAEGSCLTSVTSNIAALFFICAAGVLKMQNKLCIGYGVEAGPIPKEISEMAASYCNEVVYIARTSNAAKIFQSYGLHAQLGTDTAWSIDDIDLNWARHELIHKFGWDGNMPLVGISAMNAFIRPIRPSFLNYLKGKFLNNWNNHYDSIYFYTVNEERLNKYNSYLSALANSVKNLNGQSKFLNLLVEIEPMDSVCLNDLENKLGFKCQRIKAAEYNGAEFTALLSLLNLLISSRYHAHVLSMPVGVPCVAISKDQRLETIFYENGLSRYCFSTHDSELNIKLTNAVTKLWEEKEVISGILKKSFQAHLLMHKKMGELAYSAIHEFISNNRQIHVAA